MLIDPQRLVAVLTAEAAQRDVPMSALWEIISDRSGINPDTWQRRFHRWSSGTPVSLEDADLALTALGLHLDDVTDDAPAPKRGGGKPAGVYGYLSDTQLHALHVAHMNGASIRQLGRTIHARTPFSTAKSAAQAISTGFMRLGLTRRDRLEATVAASTVHGLARRSGKDRAHLRAQRVARGDILDRPQCAGVRQQPPGAGARCLNKAMADSDYCYSHDPATSQQRHAVLASARARRRSRHPQESA